MGTTKLDICNGAISHVGYGEEIADFDNERSAEARACRHWYPKVIDEVLRDFNWPHARVIEPLGLVAENPNEEWDFAYRYPSDCRFFRRVLSGVRIVTPGTREPHVIGKDAEGLLIYTDKIEAECEYTSASDDPAFYPPDFSAACEYLLAARIAPRLVKEDPLTRVRELATFYGGAIAKAKANAANEQQPDDAGESSFITGRG